MRVLFFAVLMIFFHASYGQKTYGGVPASFLFKGEKRNESIPGLSFSPIQKINNEMPESISIPYEVSQNLTSLGRRQKLVNGEWIWQTSFEIPNAEGMVLMFKKLNLAPGARLFFYPEDRSTVLGSYTLESNPDGEAFITGIIPGQKGILELVEPAENRGQSILEIFRVDGIISSSIESCHVGVACSEELKHARNGIVRVMMVLKEGMGFCTGSLVNNTAEDARKLVLTSFHCQDGYTPLYNLWKFEFNYFDPVCGSNLVANAKPTTVIGANYLAGRRESDFLLLEIPKEIPKEAGIVFNGWNRLPEPPSSSLIFHHPKGDLKKITTSNIPASVFNNQIQWNNQYVENGDTFNVVTPANHHFRVNYNSGFIETGSSGAPLFNAKGEILGQLHGGSQMCNNGIVYFGRLFNSWEGGGTPQTRLKDWLDPLNTKVSMISLLTEISSDTLVFAGNIKNEKETPIPNALITMFLNGNEVESQLTNASGNFSFAGLAPGSYELSIIKPDQGNNGVSTMDLIDVQKHVIQTKPFDSNLKLAAADANKSGSVTTLDMIKIRRVILGMDCCFSNQENEWLFFRQNGLIENKYPITFSQSIFDFQMTGIKIGDVNNSASTGNG